MTTPDATLSVRGYLRGLSRHVGGAWNRFWFEPSDVLNLCVLRIGVGVLGLMWQASFAFDLTRLFGTDGWLIDPVVRGIMLTTLGYDVDYLRFVAQPTALYGAHFLGSLILLALIAGLWTRAAAIASFVVVLAYVHRAPMLIGPAEPVLTMMMAYLCLAPIGAYLSLDARRRSAAQGRPLASSWSTLSRRLIQVHLVLIHLAIGLTALGGETWWHGEAIWWLSAQPDSRIVDLTFLRDNRVVLNLWSHLVILYFLAFAALVWNRWLRPLVLCVSVLMWISLAVVTANLGLAGIMIIANLAFIPSEFWRAIPRRPAISDLETSSAH